MAKAYSNDLRKRVVKNYLDGMTKEYICKYLCCMDRNIEQMAVSHQAISDRLKFLGVTGKKKTFFVSREK